MANAPRDENSIAALIAASSSDGSTPVRVWADPTTHRLLVDLSGSTGTPVESEVVAGINTAWTLANTPIAGSVHLFANGQRLTPTVDYSITAAAITTVLSWSAGTVLADYRK